jgi:hypothetical protein
MVNRSCTTCVYAWWEAGQWLASLWSCFPTRPACANHPDSPGRMRTVPFGTLCRNYRAKPEAPDLTDGTVKRIPLGDGQYAYVDAADYEWLSKYNWRLQNGYAARRDKTRTTYMHNEIMKPPQGMMVDHANHNKLDNTRANLRNCTRQENTQNNRKHMGSSSRFKGVGYNTQRGKWFSKIYFEGQRVWLGYFEDEAEAGQAYDRAAVERFGEFACVNFPEEWPPERRREVHATYQAALKKETRKARGKKGRRDTRRGSTQPRRKKPKASRRTQPARRKA